MPGPRRVHSIRAELVAKSREAALSAVQIFNNPLIQFKSETYIVLMIIAWTYLLHAYYRKIGVDYRYFEQEPGKRRRFSRTKHGSFKHWELERCLNAPACPLGQDTKNNLRFLIQLRHQIEHQMTMNLDNYLSGRYQACALNYCHYVKELFGDRQSLDEYLSYSLQFSELSRQQAEGLPFGDEIPPRLKAFIVAFDETLSLDEHNSPRYSYRLNFTRSAVNRPGQADRVVNFIPLGSEMAQAMEERAMVVKEVERQKYLMKDVLRAVRAEGYPRFNSSHHTRLWKIEDAKNPAKQLGVCIGDTWYWYESWLSLVRKHCEISAEMYR